MKTILLTLLLLISTVVYGQKYYPLLVQVYYDDKILLQQDLMEGSYFLIIQKQNTIVVYNVYKDGRTNQTIYPIVRQVEENVYLIYDDLIRMNSLVIIGQNKITINPNESNSSITYTTNYND